MLAPKNSIINELRELAPYFTYSIDSGLIEESWQKWVPNVSPRKLYASLTMARINVQKPHLSLAFTNEGSDRENGVEIEVKNQQPEYQLSLRVKNDAVYLDNIHFSPENQGQSYVKKLLQGIAALAIAIDKPHIRLKAGGHNGAYTWARFGFTITSSKALEELKQELREYRLNKDHSKILYHKEGRSKSGDKITNPYVGRWPEGFTLTPEETKVIDRVLRSDDPQKIWLLSDLGREVGRIDKGADKPPHIVTVGKALLCGLVWKGKLELEEGAPAYERFMSYLSRAPMRSASVPQER